MKVVHLSLAENATPLHQAVLNTDFIFVPL
jgi:hypothetical protein